mmetsp:Transcript_21970/g.18844  ORF Transcript_21970/g.18844 Transcript_21970/m.18844 type:complete len:108 (+) Transcript_21970:131-454(+)
MEKKVEYPEPIHNLNIEAEDEEDYDLSKHFDECFEYIDKKREECNVLVHCFAGVSRSASVVIAYLMKKNSWTYQQTHDFVYLKRPLIQPNAGFANILKKYESKILEN